MILILNENADPAGSDYAELMQRLQLLPGIESRVHRIEGELRAVTEVYLLGDTKRLTVEEMQALPCVERVVRVSEEYRILGRHRDDSRPSRGIRPQGLCDPECVSVDQHGQEQADHEHDLRRPALVPARDAVHCVVEPVFDIVAQLSGLVTGLIDEGEQRLLEMWVALHLLHQLANLRDVLW